MVWIYLGVLNMIVMDITALTDEDIRKSYKGAKRQVDILSWVPFFNIVLLCINGYYLVKNTQKDIQIYFLRRRGKKLAKEYEELMRRRQPSSPGNHGI
jgi:hypothetical protein